VNEKEFGDPIVGAMFGVCIGYYLAQGVPPEEIGALAVAIAGSIAGEIAQKAKR
jgi:hypothetical protein